jgi:hypothetical protein
MGHGKRLTRMQHKVEEQRYRMHENLIVVQLDNPHRTKQFEQHRRR